MAQKCGDTQLTDSEGMPIEDEDFLQTLADFETEDDGKSFIYKGKEIPCERVLQWREDFENLRRKFAAWCKSSALVEQEEDLGTYLAAPDGLLDFAHQSVDWDAYFESACEATIAGKDVPGRIVETRIDFEDGLHLSKINNRWLFPSRERLLEEAGGFESKLPDPVYYEKQMKRPKHARYVGIPRSALKQMDQLADACVQLDLKFHQDRRVMAIIGKLQNDAVESYTSGEYDADKVFDAFKESIRKWAKGQMLSLSIARNDKELQERIVSRLAVIEMIDYEGDMVSAVAKAAFDMEAAKPSLTDDKIERYRRGTYYHP